DLVCQTRHALKDRGREREGVDAVKRDAIVAPNGGLAVPDGIPRKADRGPNVVEPIVHELARNEGQRARQRIAVADILIRHKRDEALEYGSQTHVIAEAVVKHKVWCDVPGVLYVEVVLRPARVHDV